MKTTFMKIQALVLGFTLLNISGALAYSVKPNFNLTKFIQARAATEVDDIFVGARNMKLGNMKLSEQNDLQGGTITVSKQYSNFDRKLSSGSAHYEDGYARETYHLRTIEGRAYRVLDHKVMSETRMPLSLGHPYLPDNGEQLWRIQGQILSSGTKSDKSLLDTLKIELGTSPVEKVQKSVVFQLDSSFPAGSEIIGYKSNKDLSRLSVHVLQGNKVVEHTFDVSKSSKLTRVGMKELPLSDFYAGDIQPRTATAAGAGAKGMRVSGSY